MLVGDELLSVRCFCITFTAEENECVPKDKKNNVYTYPLTGGAVLLVSLPLGMLFGYLCFRFICSHEQKESVPSHLPPVYEEVKVSAVFAGSTGMNMVENEAYTMPEIPQLHTD